MADFTIKSGSTAPALVVTLLDGDDPVDLTGTTVTMRMRSVEGGLLVVDDVATIDPDPTTGRVTYQWITTDTDEVGDFEAEWEVDFGGGVTQVYPRDDYTTITVEPSLTSGNPVFPDLPDNCWPVDTSCCSDFDTYSPTIQAQALALAGQTMRMLTGYSVGGCAVDLRPCAPSCAQGATDWTYSNGVFHPHIGALGTWLNSCPCGPGGCSCTVVSEIILPTFAGAVESVSLGGVDLPASAYRVDNGNRLVRLDGEAWPTCQDMNALPSAEGSFVVRYLPARPVDRLGAVAAGYLACEYAKSCAGQKCALPKSVTQVTRQGITMTMTPGAFPKGLTNIPIVDAYILAYNPHGLTQPSAIHSLDMPQFRVTTIPPGV